jgi:Asp-tRNA(Asn)/Glu-tRNA(Gln) amidotransferase A subunit family amidase
VNRKLAKTEESVRASILSLDLPSLIKALHNNEFTPLQALHAYQEAAIKAHERTNCLCELIEAAEVEALQLVERFGDSRSELPLYGVPFSVKESIQIKGCVSTRGFAQYLGDIETEDAQCVATLRQLGAIPFARTNVPQSLMSFGCSNPIYGTTSGPYCKTRSAGGSSGGEGALVGAKGTLFGSGYICEKSILP